MRRRTARREWAEAETLADLGRLTARWVEGDITYHPNSYDGGPDPETRGIVKPLAALNRAGFVTSSSQPGEGPVTGRDGNTWWQRANVSGFCESPVARRIQAACAGSGLIVIQFSGARRWRCDYNRAMPVTAGGENKTLTHTHSGVHLSRAEVRLGFDGYLYQELCAAEQVTVIDPVWGRADHLWSVLTHGLRGGER